MIRLNACVRHFAAAATSAISLLGTGVLHSAPLPRGNPESEGVDPRGVLRFVSALEGRVNAVHSLMLVRHGKVVAEGWWAPYTAEDLHLLYSVTKSFTSTAVGLASQEGRLNVHDRILQHLGELAPEKPAEQMNNMRIADLLRMSTGHQNDMNPVIKANKDGHWVEAFLRSNVEFKPGTRFVYNSAASYVLGALVQKVSQSSLEDYLKPRLFDPLGIEHWHWAKSPEGINLGDGGLALTTESLAKFGQLYLQKGVWSGKRVVPEQWVLNASARQTATGGDPNSNWDHGYGYQFWRNKVTGYRADGAFGQFSMIFPEHDAVLAMTSGTSDMGGVMDTVWGELLPALRVEPLVEDPEGRAALREKLAGLSLAPTPSRAAPAATPEGLGVPFAFPKNELGLTEVQVDSTGSDLALRLVDESGSHSIACGIGHWTRGTTGYQRGISGVGQVETQGVSASCGWTERGTLVAKLCFHETPYTITHTFAFGPQRLIVDTEHNLRWGDTKRPTLVGRRRGGAAH